MQARRVALSRSRNWNPKNPTSIPGDEVVGRRPVILIRLPESQHGLGYWFVKDPGTGTKVRDFGLIRQGGVVRFDPLSDPSRFLLINGLESRADLDRLEDRSYPLWGKIGTSWASIDGTIGCALNRLPIFPVSGNRDTPGHVGPIQDAPPAGVSSNRVGTWIDYGFEFVRPKTNAITLGPPAFL